MNKKGAFNVIVTIAILLVFLAVILLFVIGPEAILSKAAQAGEWIANDVLGKLRKDRVDKPNIEVDEAVEEIFNNLVSEDGVLRSQGNGPCILTHKDFPKDFKDNKITLSQSEQGILVQLINEQNLRKTATIAGKVPCVVDAENFYENYLDGTICQSDCKDNCRIANIEFRDGKHIHFDGQEAEFEDGNLLFKTADGNVCFFPIDVDFWRRGCNERGYKIDSDCIEIIKERLESC